MKKSVCSVWTFLICLAVFIALQGMTVFADTLFPRFQEHEDGAHEWIVEWEDSATCEEPGLVEYYCRLCGESKEETTPPLGHSWGDWIISEYPDCTHVGFRYRVCERCNQIYQETLPIGDHTYGDWVVDWEATCVSTGSMSRSCLVCGETQTQVIPMTDHSFGYWTVDWDATCTTTGQRSRTCWVCYTTQTEVIPVTDHTWGEWKVTREATGRSQGTRQSACQICGQTRQENYDPEGTLRRGSSGDEVRKLQEALNQAGFDCGTADGIFGQKTEQGVKAYEASTDFTVDGIAWPDLQKKLYGGPDPDRAQGSLMPVTLFIIQTSPELSAYEVGSFVSYDIALQNTSGKDLKDWTVYAAGDNSPFRAYGQPYGANGGGNLAMMDSTDVMTHIHTITDEDLARGQVSMKWTAAGTTVDGEKTGSNVVEHILPVIPAKEKDPQASLSLSVKETAGTKSWYLPDTYGYIGHITYAVTVTNTGTKPLRFRQVRCFRGSEDVDGIFAINLMNGGHVLAPGESFDTTMTYNPNEYYKTPGGASEIFDGLIEPSFEAYGMDPETDVVICASGRENFKYPLRYKDPSGEEPGGVHTDKKTPSSGGFEVLDPSSEDEDKDNTGGQGWSGAPGGKAPDPVSIEMNIISYSTSPLGYTLNDDIYYAILVTNLTDSTIIDLDITDPYKGTNEDAVIEHILELPAHQTKVLYFTHTVVQDDVQRHYVDHQAEASWYDESMGQRLTVSTELNRISIYESMAGGNHTSSDNADLTIFLVPAGRPDNISFYEEGETIHYSIIVINSGGRHISEVIVYEPLKGGTEEFAAIENFYPTSSRFYTYDYEVTADDAAAYTVSNAVYAVYFFDDGKPHWAFSDKLVLPTGPSAS